MSIAEYAIQQWLFDHALGRYDIDLAESGVQPQRLEGLRLDPKWELDYSLDRGGIGARSAVADLYGRPGTRAAEVVITHGAQEALYLLYRSLLSAGDHVVTTSPGWQQAWELPRHIGCDVTVLQWRPGDPFDVDALRRAVCARTRLLTLNSPGNPSGCVIANEEWASILDIAAARHIWVVNDEEYLLDFGESVIQRSERALSVCSLSKVYGLPALRLGWACGPGELIERMVNYKRYTTISNSVLCERVAEQVLEQRQCHVSRYRSLVASGLALLGSFAAAHSDHVRLVPPQGTPYAWLHVDSPGGTRKLAERLLEEHRVLVMPAEVFGAKHGLRVSFARPPRILQEGLERLGTALSHSG